MSPFSSGHSRIVKSTSSALSMWSVLAQSALATLNARRDGHAGTVLQSIVTFSILVLRPEKLLAWLSTIDRKSVEVRY